MARNREGGRSLPQGGVGPVGVTWGLLLLPHVDNQYVCFVRFFTPLCSGSGF